MIDFLKNWTTNLVIFIIIISFLEMILPNGNIRKFVKMTIGLIVILVIINPFIKLIQSDIDIEKEIFNNIESQYEYRDESYKEFEDYKDKQVKSLYINKIKNEIDNEIISKTNYRLSEIYIDIDESKDTDRYGNIQKINMKLVLQESDSAISIEKESDIRDIKIDIKLEDVKEKNEQAEQKESKNNLKVLDDIEDKISKKFEIDKENIFIDLKTND